MKFKFFTLLMLLPLASVVWAQSEGGSDENTFPGNLFPKGAVSKWSLGVFAGPASNHHVIDVAYATDMKYTDKSGYSAGIGTAFHPTGWFALRVDVAMVQKNYRLDRDNRFLSFVYTESTNNYLSVPVVAVLSAGRNFKVSGIVGGYGGWWLSGRREGQSLSVSYLITGNQGDTFFDEEYKFNDSRDNRFDAGIVYGFAAQCTIAKKVELSAEMRWYYGLTDVQKNYMTNLNPRYNTTRVIQFGAAYWF